MSQERTCTFFGHSLCPNGIVPKLQSAIIELIEKHGVDTFYVGNHGQYDALVRHVLRQLKKEYPHITYSVVLAYLPQGYGQAYNEHFSDTLYPEGIELIHPRFAISWRNRWLLEQSGYVITYITHSWGGAAQFAQKAKRQNKTVINLF